MLQRNNKIFKWQFKNGKKNLKGQIEKGKNWSINR